VGALTCVANAAAANPALYTALPAYIHEQSTPTARPSPRGPDALAAAVEDLHRMHPELARSLTAPSHAAKRVRAAADPQAPAPAAAAEAHGTPPAPHEAPLPADRDPLQPICAALTEACALLSAGSSASAAVAAAAGAAAAEGGLARGRLVEATRLLALCERCGSGAAEAKQSGLTCAGRDSEFGRVADFNRPLSGCSEWYRLLSRWLRRFVTVRSYGSVKRVLTCARRLAARPRRWKILFRWRLKSTRCLPVCRRRCVCTSSSSSVPCLLVGALFVAVLTTALGRLLALGRLCLSHAAPLSSPSLARFAAQMALTRQCAAVTRCDVVADDVAC
jgi:hypothetical protein